MGKRWKALAVFAAFLLSLPTGCGTAEDLNATDTAKEETGAGTDTGGKGETAGESQTAGAYTYHLETEEMAAASEEIRLRLLQKSDSSPGRK